jgi:hypothetical protein
MSKRKYANNSRPSTQTNVDPEKLERVHALLMRQMFNTQQSLFGVRTGVGGGSEMGYDGTRDISLVAGYKQILTFDDYFNAYNRQDIATRVVETYPTYTWMNHPEVYETNDPVITDFEKSWNKLVTKHQLFSKFKALDILAGIGQFGVMVIGFDDGGALTSPCDTASSIVYLRPYSEGEVIIKEWELDPTSERYMQPKIYTVRPLEISNISMNGGAPMPIAQFDIHHSRVLHYADGQLNSTVFGTPRLRRVYDRLADITKIVAGSAEMFYRGAWSGYSFEAEPEGEFSDEDKTAMKEMIKNFMMGMDRSLLLKGVKANQLSPSIASPKEHLDAQLTMVSIAASIPKRILAGSEQGKLASTEDAKNWAKQIKCHAENDVEPNLLRPFIDRCIAVGVLTAPKEGEYMVDWKPIEVPTTKDTSESAMNFTSALSMYISGNMYEAMPLVDYLVQVWEYDVARAEAVAKNFDVENLRKIKEEEQKRADDAVKAKADAAATKQLPKPRASKGETSDT